MAANKSKTIIRCPWCEGNDVMRKYHHEEWGTPLYDDKNLFEFLVLDAFQAGLTWNIILQKRENFRKAFANFDVKKVAKFGDNEVQKLLAKKVLCGTDWRWQPPLPMLKIILLCKRNLDRLAIHLAIYRWQANSK